MGLSINTNRGAMAALQNLNATNKMLERTQLNITTGLKVNGPKDDASTYAIAQNMRGDIAGMTAVRTALANGEATLDVAITAGQSISDLLTEMKARSCRPTRRDSIPHPGRPCTTTSTHCAARLRQSRRRPNSTAPT